MLTGKCALIAVRISSKGKIQILLDTRFQAGVFLAPALPWIIQKVKFLALTSKIFSERNTAVYVHQESGITPENMAALLHLCRVL